MKIHSSCYTDVGREPEPPHVELKLNPDGVSCSVVVVNPGSAGARGAVVTLNADEMFRLAAAAERRAHEMLGAALVTADKSDKRHIAPHATY